MKMKLTDFFLAELEREVSSSRLALQRVPFGERLNIFNFVHSQGMVASVVAFVSVRKADEPADAKAVKCETKVAIASGIHAAAITNCNAALAKQLFKGKTFDTASCEAKATSRLMATKTTDCPSCIRLEAIDSFQKFLLHANAGLVFCASPSGAFVGGVLD